MSNDTITIEYLRGLYADDAAEIEEVSGPIHPGEILREEFMAPLKLSAGQVAKALDLPRSRIERIVKEEIGVSADTALRLGKLFRTTPQLWMNLQATFERETTLKEIAPDLARIEPILVPEAA